MRVGTAASAFAAVAVWATNAVAAKYALAALTVPQVLALQFSGAAAVLGLVCLVERRARLRAVASGWMPLLIGIVGVCGTIAFQYGAFRLAPIAQANLVAYAWPLLVAAFLALAARSASSFSRLLLAALGLIGAALIITDGQSVGVTSDAMLGYGLAGASAVCMALYTLAANRVKAHTAVALLQSTLIGSLVCAAALLLGARSAPWLSLPVALGIYTGIGPMALGYLFWTRAMGTPGGSRLAPIAYTTPLVSTGLLVLAGEPLTAIDLLGGAMVLGCSLGTLLLSGNMSDRRARLRSANYDQEVIYAAGGGS